jgi:hypothetical protein
MKSKFLKLFVLGLCIYPAQGIQEVSSSGQDVLWSCVYKKTYSDEECEEHTFLEDLLFSAVQVIPFTQLVVSFNADRPTDGSFEFFLRVHVQGKDENDWEPWNKIASWTDSSQKSFFSKTSDATFNYVRLEMNQKGEGKGIGDGFQVRVEKSKNASLQGIKGLFVCASNYKEFKTERPYLAVKNLESVRVQKVPKKSQKLIDHPRIGALCSPTTLSMILEFLLDEPIDPLETARNVYDEGLDVFGSWPFNMAYAFEKTEGRFFFYTARLSSFAQLHTILSTMPVGVSVRGNIKGARKNYPSGHFLVVVGYDAPKKQVICFDPAFDTLDKVEVAYDIAEFLPAWERSNRLIYCVRSRA